MSFRMLSYAYGRKLNRLKQKKMLRRSLLWSYAIWLLTIIDSKKENRKQLMWK